MCVGTVGVVQCASFVDNTPGQLLVAHFSLCVEALISQHSLSADYPNPGWLDG